MKQRSVILLGLVGSVLVLVAQPAFAQAPPPAQPPPPPGGGYGGYAQPQGPFAHHSGVMVGFGFGVGAVSCDGCESSAEIAFDFSLGGFLNPQLALMWDYGGLVNSEDGVSAVLASHTVAAQYWVAPQAWIKGGIGVSQAYVSIDGFGSDSEFGFAVLGAAGYEVMTSGNFVLDLSGRVSLLDFDEVSEPLVMFSGVFGVRWR